MKFLLRKSTWILLAIILLGIFFRSYNFANSFVFEHDQDLYSWIAKDIVVNHHLRLIGQVTSIDGFFIGPLFYYLVALLYLITSLNPLSVVMISVGIGVLTIFSVYCLFKTFFNQSTAIIGALLTSVSLGIVMYDRWIVPTVPSILWSVWLLYLSLALLNKKLKALPLFGLLVGLVWHIHIALLPLVFLPLIAYLLSGDRTLFNLKKSWPLVVVSLAIFFIISSPFWLFELKHEFGQTKSVLTGSQTEVGEVAGVDRFFKITGFISKNLVYDFIYPVLGKNIPAPTIYGVFLILWIFIDKKKILSRKYSFVLMAWLILVIAFHFLTKRNLSEYYLTNTAVVFLCLLSLFLSWMYQHLKILTIVFLVIYTGFNLWSFTRNSDSETSFAQKQALVDYIQADATSRSFPCVHINYIADFGTNVGFRFLFWKDNLHLINTTPDVPSYDIVIPWQVSEKEVNTHFGRFGVIKPKGEYTISEATCTDSKNQLLPLLGYND
ncbi:hypothetical protein A2631_03065 [Candidatus Daviesbacteria bacterium RIFCSPHIGHO2_01_FULL_44_29]|uniref:Glycosyltransferase RgtA/B/C/D-like domain-containing protein n=1 Tax=Candidatus Daviesbacteria bacterium RIFCSPHIGHO2_02_FULL_43_12 TaxID=1797776 RepID=A0A1F5KKG4_9BACT|nr:MAG: hypothetical protein A2631_03065 [Candidatus Daviesbacteria bacterium RIFCSPHIGHO2_01_FULL_44_29]OGE40783.1 MAG: hypothetical protein A3E86_02280 [Candidatus Daviesbacteria bacterium RIFCSPHIGHO2_12_FULL_47_45]OGE41364.1 MAG: hypothetical protein A3D25_02460 [Candidatus Daviesbacteria bacterium RIFCSPHIGHO2_02_FULL_43_12]OGE69565.1 MAG: hypothetical protein A3B55_04205 [Candidatus Daviesbacteria bacterium RIFCSPLOWO2_01_FULL_43_15]